MMPIMSATNAVLGRQSGMLRPALIALALSTYFVVWWLHLRPGVFSFDSGFYLSQAISGDLVNRKPFFYARFIQLTSFGGTFVPATVFAQVALIVLMLARAFELSLRLPVHIGWKVLGVAVVANPYLAQMAFYLQNDVLFSFAMAALAIETLYLARGGSMSWASILVVMIVAPMALLFRENGLLFVPLWIVSLFFLLPRRSSQTLALTAIVACLIAAFTAWGVDREERHDMFYPSVIHEAVRLAVPSYRYELGGRLSPETRGAIGMDNLRSATAVYWPLYWDTIAFFPDGPSMVSLPKAQRERIVVSFLKHDLLPNLPSIVAHRVEIFVGALFASAEYVDPYLAPANLPPALKDWKSRMGARNRGAGTLGMLVDASIQTRAWTWNAAFGLLIAVVMSLLAFWRRDKSVLAISFLLVLQATAVCALAPSAEYRYVFVFYLAPLIYMIGSAASPITIEKRDAIVHSSMKKG
jgi:hypothetical protein